MVIDWPKARRVLVVRLRSIGDTVLATPSLVSLRRFLPHAEIDVLLEDWVAPLLQGSEVVDRVVAVGRSGGSRTRAAWKLRRRGYDIAFNLHGGTTGTFFTFASGARHRVGYGSYQYPFLYNHLLTECSPAWPGNEAHSAQQQLALLEHIGVPVDRQERSALPRNADAELSINARIGELADLKGSPMALMHPAAAFATKTWPVENFARTAEYLQTLGLSTVAVAGPSEKAVLQDLARESGAPVAAFSDLSLPEITALARRASLFVGNDSGIAHIAAAVGTPSVVVFGSSNINFWRPWTDAPNEVVSRPFPCRPCPGNECGEFGEPRCIKSVDIESVAAAVERVLKIGGKKGVPTGPALFHQ